MTQGVSLYHRNWLERRHHLRLIEHAAQAYARGTLLDVGCGTKPYAELFTPYVESYIGLDLPPERDIVRHPQQAALRWQAPDVHGSALTLPFAGNVFDTLISFQVLEHVTQPWQALQEMGRVLKPGGYLLLSTPQMWHLHETPHDFYRFTPFGLRYLCQQAGLAVDTVQPFAGFWARAGLKLTYRFDWLGRGLRRLHPRLSHLPVPFIACVNLLFGGLDWLLPNREDSAVLFLIAYKPAS
jgi:SAM-dependent methyltransferase